MLRMHRGVYLLGPIAPPLAREMAAVLACGEGAVLSHRSAAYLHGLLAHPAEIGLVDVTVVGRNPGQHPGIRVHRVAALPPDEITVREWFRVTTAARTALDLACELPTGDLEQLIAEAHRRRLASAPALELLTERHRGRAGSRALRTLLRAGDPAFTRSPPERLLLTLLRRAKLPPPQVNAPLGRFEVDLLWPDLCFAVEVDSYAFHSARPDRERDHARDAELARRGYRLLRVGRTQVINEPEATIALIARELGPASRPS